MARSCGGITRFILQRLSRVQNYMGLISTGLQREKKNTVKAVAI